MSESRLHCPSCESFQTVKNGSPHHKKPKFKCQACGRQFVQNYSKKVISSETKSLIDKLLLEKISLAGIARVTGVSEKWLQDYVNSRYAQTPRQVQLSSKSECLTSRFPRNVRGTQDKKGKIVIQCDEAWSFVGNKENKQWIWLALNVKRREIVGVNLGERGESGARGLWESLPAVYRQCAVCYTDFWEAYPKVLPRKRHQPLGKETGLTNLIERLNNTLRQRVSRLVRKTLSFSKKWENHIGAIWNFVHHYNASLVV